MTFNSRRASGRSAIVQRLLGIRRGKPRLRIATWCLFGCAMMFSANAQAAYNVTVVAAGASSGGSWIGNTWIPSANGSTVLASEVATHLANGPTRIGMSSGGTEIGDLFVNGAVSWSANTFTLRAAHNINIAAALTGTGAAALALEYGQGAVAAGNTAVYSISTPVKLQSNPNNPAAIANFSTKRGSDGSTLARAVPRCPRITRNGFSYPGCDFLDYGTPTPTTFDIQYSTVEINGAANTDIWTYINQSSQFTGTYLPVAMSCQAGQGNFYFPDSTNQVNDFGPGGTILNLTNLLSDTSRFEPCKMWEFGPVHVFYSSDIFINGYYVKFRPNLGDSGNGLQILSLLSVDPPTGATSYVVVDYIFNVHFDMSVAFSFTDQTGVPLSTLATSNAITVAGLANAAAISVTGGEYEINGSGTWATTAGTINNGDTVKVRHTSSAAYSTTMTTVLTIGGVSGGFSTTTVAAPGTTPNAFAFTDQTNVALSTLTTSDAITVAGITSAVAISVAGGEYEINGSGTWVTTAGTVSNGDTVKVRHTSSAVYSTTTTTVLTIGGVSGGFSTTTMAAPGTAPFTTPDGFAFTDQTGVALSSLATSNAITVGGIDAAAAISITGGSYAINGGAYTAVAGLVNNGDTVTVQQTSSASYSTLTTATLTIGGVSAAFNVTTLTVVYTAPSATGTGNITASVTGGGATCGFTHTQFVPLSSVPTPPPAGLTFPEGIFDFSLGGCTPGGTVTLTITYPQPLPPGSQYWKYGPTPGNTTAHWYSLNAAIHGNTVTFSITDGGVGDDDLTANGAVAEPGGPGAGVAANVPTLSQWALLLLVLSSWLVGAVSLRRARPIGAAQTVGMPQALRRL